ncbi:hypothetical protein BRC66_04265 [Halobacteriales archaeon QH_2_66_30]|nr:MAG: hypothetical protein BRC66_04265 [Halobacteriales archaeon QH_2_66_30]
MQWRCEWCGKPHEENDPPCDNCGHGTFEKAVVRQTDLGDGENDPALMWVCTECGREHPKNAPPCSRCGSVSLEKRRQEIDESELTAPGYLELVNAGDVPLAAVEDEFASGLIARYGSEGGDMTRDGDLDAVARYLNQQAVKRAVGDSTTTPTVEDSVREVANDACGQTRPIPLGPYTIDVEQETAAASALGQSLLEEYRNRVEPSSDVDAQLGVDVHEGPDGDLWLLVVIC